jgi:hypothetical protein
MAEADMAEADMAEADMAELQEPMDGFQLPILPTSVDVCPLKFGLLSLTDIPGSDSIPITNPASAVAAHTDRPPQCPGVDQNRDSGLGHAYQSEHEKLGVVEDGEGLYTGCPESENQGLNTGDHAHQHGVDRVVYSGMGDLQLLGQRHHRRADHEDFNPREMVLTPLDQGSPRIREDELPGYEKSHNI